MKVDQSESKRYVRNLEREIPLRSRREARDEEVRQLPLSLVRRTPETGEHFGVLIIHFTLLLQRNLREIIPTTTPPACCCA
jgi:hypothetical protein